MAEWEAPITATVVGVEGERVLVSLEGERAVSRGRGVRWEREEGRAVVVGEEPVQRIRREASIWRGEVGEAGEEIEIVQVDCGFVSE